MTSRSFLRLYQTASLEDAKALVDSHAGSIDARERSPELVETLLANCLDTVYRYALRLTGDRQQAEDLTQETMLQAWKHRNSLKQKAAARVWLLKIATNLWTDRLRKKDHQLTLLVEAPLSRERRVGEKLIHEENVTAVLKAVDQLPARQRQVMHLITIEQLTHAEVAEVLQISPQAVKASLAAARKTLRQQLSNLYREVCGKEHERQTIEKR